MVKHNIYGNHRTLVCPPVHACHYVVTTPFWPIDRCRAVSVSVAAGLQSEKAPQPCRCWGCWCCWWAGSCSGSEGPALGATSKTSSTTTRRKLSRRQQVWPWHGRKTPPRIASSPLEGEGLIILEVIKAVIMTAYYGSIQLPVRWGPHLLYSVCLFAPSLARVNEMCIDTYVADLGYHWMGHVLLKSYISFNTGSNKSKIFYDIAN